LSKEWKALARPRYNETVDTFVTAEARQALEALDVLSPAKRHAGLLIGHERGHRFIVEKVLPTPAGFDPDPAVFARLDKIFGVRAIGFYTSGDAAPLKAKLRQPYAAGRLLLSVRFGRSKPAFRAWAVGFDGRFRFIPIPVIVEESRP
jgi:hypothetical protein